MTFATRRYSGERPTPDEILLAGQRLLRYSNLDRELRGHDDEARAILNYLVEEFDATAIWINDDTRVDIDLLMDELNQTNP